MWHIRAFSCSRFAEIKIVCWRYILYLFGPHFYFHCYPSIHPSIHPFIHSGFSIILHLGVVEYDLLSLTQLTDLNVVHFWDLCWTQVFLTWKDSQSDSHGFRVEVNDFISPQTCRWLEEQMLIFLSVLS